MNKKYSVSAVYWNADLKNRFGRNGDFHDLLDSDIVLLIKEFGIAGINKIGKDKDNNPIFELRFFNQFDWYDDYRAP